MAVKCLAYEKTELQEPSKREKKINIFTEIVKTVLLRWNPTNHQEDSGLY